MDVDNPIYVILVTYLLGAVPFGPWLVRGKGVDLRTQGSKSTGATNAARVAGWRVGVLTLVLDIAKGAVAASLGLQWGLRHASAGATSAVLGHCCSPFLSFRGGKGVATAVGGSMVLHPIPLFFGLMAFAAMFGLFRIVSVASLCAIWTFAASAWLLEPGGYPTLFAFMTAVMVSFCHRENVARLLRGREPRLSKAQ